MPGFYYEKMQVGSVYNGALDYKAEMGLQIGVQGVATTVVLQGSRNPGGPLTFPAIGKYVGVYVAGANRVTEVEIWSYYGDAGREDLDESALRLFWWDGSAWVECSDSGVNKEADGRYSGHIWARIRSDTTPGLADLDGAYFSGGVSPSAPGARPSPLLIVGMSVLALFVLLVLAVAGLYWYGRRRAGRV